MALSSRNPSLVGGATVMPAADSYEQEWSDIAAYVLPYFRLQGFTTAAVYNTLYLLTDLSAAAHMTTAMQGSRPVPFGHHML